MRIWRKDEFARFSAAARNAMIMIRRRSIWRVCARQIFSKRSAQSKRDALYTRARVARIPKQALISRDRLCSKAGMREGEQGAGTRRAGCAAISGSVFSDRFATPFLAVDAATARPVRSTSAGSARSFSPFASSSQPSFAQTPLASNFTACSIQCDRDTRGERGTNAVLQSRAERRGKREREADSKWILIVLLVAPRDRR